MALILADAGPLYASIAPDDQHFDQARHELAHLRADDHQVGAATTTILEAYSLVMRRFDIRTAQNWLHDLTQAIALTYPLDDEYVAALNIARRYPDQDLTLFDALLFLMSQRLNVPIWTYDHHFDTLRAQRWYPA